MEGNSVGIKTHTTTKDYCYFNQDKAKTMNHLWIGNNNSKSTKSIIEKFLIHILQKIPAFNIYFTKGTRGVEVIVSDFTNGSLH